MLFSIRPLSPEDARAIAGWRYAAPYEDYNEPSDTLLDGLYQGIAEEGGALAGFVCWGAEAQIKAAADLYAAEPALDFGMGLRPDLTGKGAGVFAASAATLWLRAHMQAQVLRLAVYEWNLRAQRVYQRAGFVPYATRGRFLMMRLDARPWHDATRPLENGMPIYPYDPGFDRHLHYRRADTGYDMSVFSMSAHTGTHIDAPAHIGLAGAVDDIPLESLNGPAQLIAHRDLRPPAIRCPRLLIDTGTRGLSLEEATMLLAQGVRTVGVSGMSVGEGEEEMAVHTLLLSSGVTVLENAALESLAPGWYEMRCLPLRMPGSDGVPVRLLLREACR